MSCTELADNGFVRRLVINSSSDDDVAADDNRAIVETRAFKEDCLDNFRCHRAIDSRAALENIIKRCVSLKGDQGTLFVIREPLDCGDNVVNQFFFVVIGDGS